jgi:hypothetical protein
MKMRSCSRVITGHQIILINGRLNPEMKKKAISPM